MIVERNWKARAGLVLASIFFVGCGAADVSGVRRDQRILAHRLADTRADVDGLRQEVSRLRGQLQIAGLAPMRAVEAGNNGPRNPTRATATARPPAAPAGPRTREATGGTDRGGSRWPSGGPVGQGPAPIGGGTPSANRPTSNAPAGWSTPPTVVAEVPAAAAPLGIDVRGDLARGANEADYRKGLEAYQRADYAGAVQGLRTFVSRNPGSPLIPYAHYWVGEAYFAEGKYYEAILAYNEIPTSWPENDRVPAAKLRQAEAFAASGDTQDARLYLKELIEKYPGTPEAAEAQQRLRSL